MAFELPALPYAQDALASSGMSAETFGFHHGKHHAAYVNNLNNALK
ncbi:MAG: superoxide dismutase [Fe], partial [Coleofasciculaceae cyanobacterium SM2_3_26]|nr:superoxide dismutase [Fe] [Coleofasciculaceae cyanobacterium SM2_3_26]